MRRIGRMGLLMLPALLIVVAPLFAQSSPRPLTIDDVLGIKAVSNARISPDGSRVLFTVRQWEPQPAKPDRKDARTHLWIVPSDAARGQARQITFGERGETSPAWSPDGRYISFLAARGAATGEGEEGPKPQIWIMRSDGGEPWKITEAKEGVGSYEWAEDSRQIAFLSRQSLTKEIEDKRKRRDDARVFESDFQPMQLWVVDVASQSSTQITTTSEFTIDGMSWAPDGSRIAFSARPTPLIRDERDDIYVATLATKQLEKIAATAATERGPAWSPDGKAIAFMATPNPNKPYGDGMGPRPLVNARLMLYDVATKLAKDVSTPAFDHNPGGPVWAPGGGRVLFGIGARAYREMFAYDVARGSYSQLTKGKMIALGSFTKDGGTAAFTMESTAGPADVYVSDASFTAPRRLTTINPQVADYSLGDAEVITWKSDGVEIEGILIKPAGYQPGRRYPLLVDVHGGPTGAHMAGFRADGQYWAGQGWAVLYPNPRGSSNYGEKFMQANIPDWGGGDYRDIMAGADEVIRRGIADPEKLAVMGWSYGGYMTCWIVSQTSRFKAAMMGAGLSNILSMYGTTDIPGYLATFYNGYPTKDSMPLYLERSGLTYVDEVTTPLLILHGAQDERVPIGQPMEFYRALKDRGKTVELVFYPREGHGLSEYYHQRDRLQRQFDWITRYTLGASATSPTAQAGR